jgi:hypothetical protein
VPRSAGRAPGGGRRRRGCGRGGRGGGGGPRQAARELVQAGTMEWTPQPIVADVGEPLGHHRRENATAARLGRQGHGLPARVVGVLVAAAALVLRDGAQAGGGQRHPVDLPAQVIQELCRAWPGRVAVDDPPRGPDRRGKPQVGPFLPPQPPTPPTQARRERRDGDPGGRAGRPPLGPSSGDPAGRHHAGPRRMGGQGTGPGGPPTQHPDQTADVVGVRGQREERLGRRTDPDGVASWWRTADHLPACVGHGAADVNVGPWQACRTSFCPPGVGGLGVACGATAVAAGVVGRGLLPALVARPPGSAQGCGPAVPASVQGATRAGPEVVPTPLQVLTPRAPADGGPLGPGRAPAPSPSGHAGRDRGGPDVHGRGRQRRVAGGGPRAPVAPPCRNAPPRHPPCSQRGRLGGPQGRAGGLVGEPTLAPHGVARLVAGGGRPGGRAVPGGAHPGAGALARPGRPPSRQPPRGERHEAVLAPCALAHPPAQAWRLEVGDLPRGARGQAPPPGVEQRQTPPGCWGLDQGQEGPDLPLTQHDRQLLEGPGAHQVQDGPGAFPRARVEEPHPRAVQAAGALSALRLLAPAEEVVAPLRVAERVRRASRVLSPRGHGGERALWGLGGQAPEL